MVCGCGNHDCRMSPWSHAKSVWRLLGPGFVTGSSDDDPSGIATYSQTGAQFGYSQLWLALWMLPFMVAIQEVCGRVGVVTGRGLYRQCRATLTRHCRYSLRVTVTCCHSCFRHGAYDGRATITGTRTD